MRSRKSETAPGIKLAVFPPALLPVCDPFLPSLLPSLISFSVWFCYPLSYSPCPHASSPCFNPSLPFFDLSCYSYSLHSLSPVSPPLPCQWFVFQSHLFIPSPPCPCLFSHSISLPAPVSSLRLSNSTIWPTQIIIPQRDHSSDQTTYTLNIPYAI